MPRRPRLAAGDLASHILIRRVGRLSLFDKPPDYAASGKKKTQESFGGRVAVQRVPPKPKCDESQVFLSDTPGSRHALRPHSQREGTFCLPAIH